MLGVAGVSVGKLGSEPGHCDVRVCTLPSSAVKPLGEIQDEVRGAESDNFDIEKDVLGDYIMKLESVLKTTKIILLRLDRK